MHGATPRDPPFALAIAVLSALLVAAGGAHAQESLYERPVVVPVPEGARIEVKRDRVYKRVGGQELRMDVYLPAERESAARLPVVLFVHGGPTGALPGPAKDAAQFTSYGRLAAASGLAAVTFTHRFTEPARMPTAATDVEDALDHVREHAEQLSVDPDRMCVWAFSAGGVFVTPLLHERPEALQCVALYYSVVDPATLEALGLEGVPETFVSEFDATEVLTGSGEIARLVIARAGSGYGPIGRGLDAFVSAALEANAPLDVMNHRRGEHAFDVVNDDPRSRDIIRRTLDIVRESLSPPNP